MQTGFNRASRLTLVLAMIFFMADIAVAQEASPQPPVSPSESETATTSEAAPEKPLDSAPQQAQPEQPVEKNTMTSEPMVNQPTDLRIPEPVVTQEEQINKPCVYDGLFVRLTMGPGYSSFSTDYPDHEFSASGFSLIPELAAGMIVAENLALTVGLSGTIPVSPDLEMKIVNASRTVSKNLMTQINAGMGVGYFFPYDIFLGGGVGVSYLVFNFNRKGINEASASIYGVEIDPLKPLDIPDASKEAYNIINGHYVGFTTNIHFGKQWWVTETSGLGFDIGYIFGLYPKKLHGSEYFATGEKQIMWYGHTVSAGITATYN